jgi:hypothetical protein
MLAILKRHRLAQKTGLCKRGGDWARRLQMSKQASLTLIDSGQCHTMPLSCWLALKSSRYASLAAPIGEPIKYVSGRHMVDISP